MKRAPAGKVPHIKWNPEIGCWEGYVFNGASRPINIASGFERGFKLVCTNLKKRHDAMVKRRKDAEAARQWYDFKAKHDIT